MLTRADTAMPFLNILPNNMDLSRRPTTWRRRHWWRIIRLTDYTAPLMEQDHQQTTGYDDGWGRVDRIRLDWSSTADLPEFKANERSAIAVRRRSPIYGGRPNLHLSIACQPAPWRFPEQNFGQLSQRLSLKV
ncbi:hypothetical protein [Bradyrhizobium sp. USDA 4504]